MRFIGSVMRCPDGVSMITVEKYLSLSCLDVEEFIGLRAYSTQTGGIGGVVKERPEDFKVWEVIEGGLDARELLERGEKLLTGIPLRKALLVLVKHNRETIRAVSELSSMLGLKPSEISICGVKDRRAEAWQFIAVPADAFLAKRFERLELNYAVAHHIGFIDELSSRSLLMNKFLINIKSASTGALSTATEVLGRLDEVGAPNFYGHQRFGIIRPISHLVGSLIVHGFYKEAIEVFVGGPTSMESEGMREMRRAFMESLDFNWVLENYPKYLRYERAVARHLASRPGDYVNALRRIPLRLRRLLVESYASYIFNNALSRSMRDGAGLLEPRIGDFATELDMHGYPQRVVEVSIWNLEEVERRIRRGRMSLVMPHVGYRVRIPRGVRGDALRSVLEEEGLELHRFSLSNMREASTSGGYRCVAIPRLRASIYSGQEGSVCMELALPRGSYATVLLRELMKPRCVLVYNGLLHPH